MNSHNENRDDGESGSSTYPARMLIPNARRSTIMYGNADHGEEPQENPANPPEVNEKLKREYRSVKDLNAVMEDVNESVEAVAEMMKEYRNTVNQTEILLKLWKAILVRAENTKATIEANVVNEAVGGIFYIYKRH
jgi:hypothetical protein